MNKYLIILPFSEKEIIIKAESILTELNEGRTLFYEEDNWGGEVIAVAPVTAMIIKIN